MTKSNSLTLTERDLKMNLKMRAITQTKYGSTDVLSLEEIDKPILSDNGVLVRVYATSINSGDWHLMRGTPFLIRFLFGGVFKPKFTANTDQTRHKSNKLKVLSRKDYIWQHIR